MTTPHELSLDEILGLEQEQPKREETGPSTAGWHRLANFARCPQMFAYRWLLGLVPQVERTPLGLGTAVHAGLAAHYQGKDPMAAVRALPDRFSHCMRQAEQILADYFDNYRSERREMVLAVEREFAIKVDGELFTRRIDLVLRHGTHAFVMDHKTAGRPENRVKEAPYDLSLATQAFVAQTTFQTELGLPYGGLILNLIGTGQEGRFIRQHVPFKARFVERIPDAIGYYCSKIKELKRVDPWHYPISGACHARYMCDYRELCLGGPAYAHLFTKTEDMR